MGAMSGCPGGWSVGDRWVAEGGEEVGDELVTVEARSPIHPGDGLGVAGQPVEGPSAHVGEGPMTDPPRLQVAEHDRTGLGAVPPDQLRRRKLGPGPEVPIADRP